MSDDQIISCMVKGRECCRQLVLAYEKGRARGVAPDIGELADADRTVTRMLSHLQEIPAHLGEHISEGEKKEYAARLMAEVSELLQRAMILEREVREGASRARKPAPALAAGPGTMLRAYGA